MLDLADVASLEQEKVVASLGRLRLERVTSPESPVFDQAYAMLDSFFGPRAELESRDALAEFVKNPQLEYGSGMGGEYHLLVAWDGHELVGVRDCYVDLDREAGVCLVALSHSYVVPEERRSGLAAILRAVAVSIARQSLAARGLVGADRPEIVVAAEMEPVNPDDLDTVVRLIAYGRSGFSVLDPRRLPYSQPDFRMPEGVVHTALPLLPVVRWVDHEHDTTMPAHVAAAFPRLFHAAHHKWLPAPWVDPSEAHALRRLSRVAAPVPVLPLPKSGAPDQIERLIPLLRSQVLPAYPPKLRGPDGSFGTVEAESERLRQRWTARPGR